MLDGLQEWAAGLASAWIDVSAGLEPPVRTIRVAGEDLPEHFDPASFDIAYATNPSTTAPIRSPSSRTCSPSSAPRHRHPEAQAQRGQSARSSGLHQRNFDAVEGGLLLWNKAAEIDVVLLSPDAQKRRRGWRSTRWLHGSSCEVLTKRRSDAACGRRPRSPRLVRRDQDLDLQLELVVPFVRDNDALQKVRRRDLARSRKSSVVPPLRAVPDPEGDVVLDLPISIYFG